MRCATNLRLFMGWGARSFFALTPLKCHLCNLTGLIYFGRMISASIVTLSNTFYNQLIDREAYIWCRDASHASLAIVAQASDALGGHHRAKRLECCHAAGQYFRYHVPAVTKKTLIEPVAVCHQQFVMFRCVAVVAGFFQRHNQRRPSCIKTWHGDKRFL